MLEMFKGADNTDGAVIEHLIKWVKGKLTARIFSKHNIS